MNEAGPIRVTDLRWPVKSASGLRQDVSLCRTLFTALDSLRCACSRSHYSSLALSESIYCLHNLVQKVGPVSQSRLHEADVVERSWAEAVGRKPYSLADPYCR